MVQEAKALNESLLQDYKQAYYKAKRLFVIYDILKVSHDDLSMFYPIRLKSKFNRHTKYLVRIG
jgi:hypothetical protein